MIVNLTCRTKDCINEDYTIPFPDPADLVICGGCHQEITDKKPVEEQA